MRASVIDYLQTLSLGSFIVSSELPFSESGVPLYIKNLKKIYVDVDQSTSESLIRTLSGVNITRDTITVVVYFANDAKTIPPNYDDVVELIRTAKDILPTTSGFTSREVDVSTSFDTDKLVTEIELRYIKLT
jgi:hypothetical protein